MLNFLLGEALFPVPPFRYVSVIKTAELVKLVGFPKKDTFA